MTRNPLTLIFASTALMAPALLPAATFTVTRFDDPAPRSCTAHSCSLREAVLSANSQPGADRIVLQPGTYNLTRIDTTPFTLEAGIGALWVSESLAIIGSDAAATRVRWSAATPGLLLRARNEILAVSGPEGGIALDVQGVTLSHGRGENGGCISVRGAPQVLHELVLRNSIVEDCSTIGSGGAIRLEGANLSMSSVQLRNNSAAYHGGAIAFSRTADVITHDVQILNNSAVNGGAVSLAGNPVPYIPSLVWIDDGSSVISGNTAERGGAIHVSLAQMTLESADGGAGNWIELSQNQAVNGGAVHATGVSSSIQHFSGVRFLGNLAQSGGAILAFSSLQVTRAEFSTNQASAGDGGAVLLPTSGLIAEASFDQVSFRNNVAKGGGGALSSGCRGFAATNVSFGGNKAASGRGQAIENTGPAYLHHTTLHSNRDAQSGSSPGIQQLYDANCGNGSNEIMRLSNSLITDYCGFNVARLRTEGGNQYGPNAGVCPAGALDQRQASDALFRLSEARFGGPVDVWGWTQVSLVQVPQRNSGLRTTCALTDVRGLPRADGSCDSGAFEQQ